ncbi:MULTISPECIES: fimbrial protein [unclassified Serratia (in: enterobacteria)]|uniref:fimbrial protein n=1 Tax=unclassified Serratia (in: enterobacteria) TaxID=2647522 RepID=UPI00068DFBC6|nr:MULTISPECIES: fimbrial protein [unclassified Serratia (in: enterobacteria)]
MHLNGFSPNALILIALSLCSQAVHAVTLNFSASIVQSTCSLSLDKSVLPLGDVPQASLRSGALVNLKPFSLRVDNCSGVAGGSQQLVILVVGAGATQDGKWLFRNSNSTAGGAGVMLVQGDTPPSYTATEVKPGDYFPLAGVGQVPVNQEFPFFAGVSCGGSTGCATIKPGALTANLMFMFAYR